MNILIAHYRPDIVSGAERSIADFVEKQGMRFQITMMTSGEGKLSEFYKQKSFNVWTKKTSTRRRLYPGLHTIQSILLAREFKIRKYNAVLCNTFYAVLKVGPACRLANIPLGIYIREYISDIAIFHKFLDRADKIFAVSKDVQKYLETMTSPGKIVVAYNYINALPILEKINLHKGRGVRLLPFGVEHPVIGMIGRITRYKQQDLFIRAIPHVLSAVPEARFVIVGSPTKKEKDYEAYLKQLVFKLGIQDKTVFLGYRADALEIISELTASCLPSTREPLGRVILESQIIGCPVVASDTGGSPEIIQDGITGLLFSPADTKAEECFAQQIIRLLRNSELREKIIANAKICVHNRFCGPENIRQLGQFLEELATRDNGIHAARPITEDRYR